MLGVGSDEMEEVYKNQSCKGRKEEDRQVDEEGSTHATQIFRESGHPRLSSSDHDVQLGTPYLQLQVDAACRGRNVCTQETGPTGVLHPLVGPLTSVSVVAVARQPPQKPPSRSLSLSLMNTQRQSQ
jgi:hypothetical protein